MPDTPMPTPDSLVLLLICSRLALPKDSDLACLPLREWNPLVRRLQIAGLSPGALLDRRAADIQALISISPEQAARLTRLLERQEALGEALNRLAARGILALTRADRDYPARYRQRLKDSAPAALFYAGEAALLGQPGLAVVGSRHLDPAGEEAATSLGNACGISGQVLYSGGAIGVDTISLNAALEARGSAVAVMADNLEKAVHTYRDLPGFSGGDVCLVSPYLPDSGFSVGAAMGRNRLIYALADYAVVVASDAETGGTWAGATEALRHKWVPVFVLDYPEMPAGNHLLLQNGARSLPYPFPTPPAQLAGWLSTQASEQKPSAAQLSLF
ncbi:MAG TPA: DNA-processing protein DprA [Anaerolineales bacterium]|nr:DNA-processing protein DprA [Anaerolineales bacterium]